MPDALEARRRRSEAAFYRLFDGVAYPGGVWAAVTPSLPDRSLFNAVTYDDPGAFLVARGEIASLYASRGVRAWTVWVHAGDDDVAAALEADGHKLDATPQAMGAWLGDLDLAGHDVGEPVTWADAIAINEAAYGAPPGSMAAPEKPEMRLLGVPGQACVGRFDVDGDAWIGLVATHPSARGRGLCSSLMRQTLREAAAAGCTSTSLEGSPMGEPIYARLGYERLGRLEMWERREPAPDGSPPPPPLHPAEPS